MDKTKVGWSKRPFLETRSLDLDLHPCYRSNSTVRSRSSTHVTFPRHRTLGEPNEKDPILGWSARSLNSSGVVRVVYTSSKTPDHPSSAESGPVWLGPESRSFSVNFRPVLSDVRARKALFLKTDPLPPYSLGRKNRRNQTNDSNLHLHSSVRTKFDGV